jgi:hypothetical protein
MQPIVSDVHSFSGNVNVVGFGVKSNLGGASLSQVLHSAAATPQIGTINHLTQILKYEKSLPKLENTSFSIPSPDRFYLRLCAGKNDNGKGY